MVEFQGQISHRFARAKTLAAWRANKVKQDTICDADSLLLAAAKFHGVPASTPCPICNKTNLREVLWVYGDVLKRAAGSARSLTEIEQFAAAGLTFTVHRVEVCTNCKWNYLLMTAIAAPSYKSDT